MVYCFFWFGLFAYCRDLSSLLIDLSFLLKYSRYIISFFSWYLEMNCPFNWVLEYKSCSGTNLLLNYLPWTLIKYSIKSSKSLSKIESSRSFITVTGYTIFPDDFDCVLALVPHYLFAVSWGWALSIIARGSCVFGVSFCYRFCKSPRMFLSVNWSIISLSVKFNWTSKRPIISSIFEIWSYVVLIKLCSFFLSDAFFASS